MHFADLVATVSSSATVCAAFVGAQAFRANQKEQEAETQRNLARTQQTLAIQTAVTELGDKLGERFDRNDALTAATIKRVDRLDEAQFGDNHGGARQAINELTTDQKAFRKEVADNFADIGGRMIRVETILMPPTGPPA